MKETNSHLRVLFFLPYFYPYISGVTQYPYRLFTEQREKMTVTCLTFKYKNDLANSFNISPQCSVIRMPFLFRISKGFISPQSLFIFWSELKKHDIVMLNIPNFEGVFLALLAKLRRKSIVSLLHSEVYLPPGIINRVINFVLNIGIYLQLEFSEKIIIYDMDYYGNKPFYRRFKNKMQIVIPPIHSEKPDIEYRDYLKKINKQKICVGFCGRIAYEKGINVLIDALKELKDVHIFFAGPYGKDVVGENEYYLQIKKRLDLSRISYTFLGILSDAELSSFYRSVDVLVLPSINKTEAFGLVQIEAMFQGTPVVASDLPGVRVPLQLSSMGKTVPPGDSKSLAEAIYEVATQRIKYSNTQLINTVKHIFSSQKTYKTLYNLLSSYAKKS